MKSIFKGQILLCILCFCLASCATIQLPHNGTWYSETLEIEISFDEKTCYAVLDGKMISCDCIQDKGSDRFFILTQEKHGDFAVGTVLLSARITHIEDSVFCVKDQETGFEYSFICVSEGEPSSKNLD